MVRITHKVFTLSVAICLVMDGWLLALIGLVRSSNIIYSHSFIVIHDSAASKIKHRGLETFSKIYLCVTRRIVDISASACVRLFSGWNASAG
jgi:hypothetical protein